MRKNLFLILSLLAATLAFAQEPATFEDVQLGSNGIWQPPFGSNEMPSGGWLFTNNTQNGYWGGFTASNRTDLTASMNGKILVMTRQNANQATADLTMRATSDGQSVNFNIHVVIKGVEGVSENPTTFMAYPNPTSAVLTLTVADAQGFDYEVYDLSGQAVMHGSVVGQETHIDLGDCRKGVYFVSVVYNDNRLIQKVIVR